MRVWAKWALIIGSNLNDLSPGQCSRGINQSRPFPARSLKIRQVRPTTWQVNRNAGPEAIEREHAQSSTGEHRLLNLSLQTATGAHPAFGTPYQHKMELSINTQATGFDSGNAKLCAFWASAAYSQKPDITGLRDTCVLIRDLGHCLVVAFQGTRSIAQAITDAEAWMARVTEKMLTGLVKVGVHFGGWAALASVMAELEKALIALGWCADKPVFACGHSLGGLLALFFGFRLAQEYPGGWLHSVYTWGAPKPGNGPFRKLYNSLLIGGCSCSRHRDTTLGDRTFCFVNPADVVPQLPLWAMSLYRSVGQTLFFSDGVTWNPAAWCFWLSDLFALGRFYFGRQEIIMANHHMQLYLERTNQLA